MNGIEPPIPTVRHGLPNTDSERPSRVARSHGASGGAFQPSAASVEPNSTCAPNGTSVVTALRVASSAAAESAVGGSRKLSLNVLDGRSTLPASAGAGKPAAPITERVG